MNLKSDSRAIQSTLVQSCQLQMSLLCCHLNFRMTHASMAIRDSNLCCHFKLTRMCTNFHYNCNVSNF